MRSLILAAASAAIVVSASAQPVDPFKDVPDDHFDPLDVFGIEYAADPQIAPNGRQIAYVRAGFDIQKDNTNRDIWLIGSDGSEHRPLLSGLDSFSSPRWSPGADRLAYVSNAEGSAEIYVRFMDSGQTAKVTNLAGSPSNLTWSPDGKMLAFTMRVPGKPASFAVMPPKPKGAEWAAPVTVVTDLRYKADGIGMLEPGFTHLFIVPAEGGTPRQLTTGDFNHNGGFDFTPDGAAIIVAANRREDWQLELSDSELYRLSIVDGTLTQLTDRFGPDGSPVVSPNGRQIAYIGYDDDTRQGYNQRELYVANIDGSRRKLITGGFDRSINSVDWAPNGNSLIVSYEDSGRAKLASLDLSGRMRELADNVGGGSVGRPYPGSLGFSVAENGRIAFTQADVARPAEVALADGRRSRTLTALNEDLLGHQKIGAVKKISTRSSVGDFDVEGWLITPPDFDPSKSYPMILEIHGGPFANYGERFSAELQLFAAAGYVVLYTNPRGSTGYGKAFGDGIHHSYPGKDYDDLMSLVDAAIAEGNVDENKLFVTGGSGGGVLTAWIVGKTDRFASAVVAKPVINWSSFVLNADFAGVFHKYWFPTTPWENPEHYWARSPLSLVGNVTTPTMLLTGEADVRTPMSETEQYYGALKIAGVETAMVRVPGAFHGIARKPSQLVAKSLNILAWFAMHPGEEPAVAGGDGDDSADD